MLSLLEARSDSQRLGISFEATEIPHLDVERFFALVPEWRVSKVVAPAGELDQVDIQPVCGPALQIPFVETNGDRLRDLANLQGVSQAIPEVVRLHTGKQLRLALQATERRRVDQTRRIASCRGTVSLNGKIYRDRDVRSPDPIIRLIEARSSWSGHRSRLLLLR